MGTDNLQTIIRAVLKKENKFAYFVNDLSQSQITTSVRDVKKYTKRVGDMWEEFCCLYLTEILGWQAEKLADCPEDELKRLTLKTRDVGIDIIARDSLGNYIAVQCKYRKNFQKLSWRDVSTFDALCMRTGPWHKCIIMTTSKSLHREGQWHEKDLFWGKNYFDALSWYSWLSMAKCGNGYTCGSDSAKVDIRQARLMHFE